MENENDIRKKQQPTVAFRCDEAVKEFYERKAEELGIKPSVLFREKFMRAYKADLKAEKRKAA